MVYFEGIKCNYNESNMVVISEEKLMKWEGEQEQRRILLFYVISGFTKVAIQCGGIGEGLLWIRIEWGVATRLPPRQRVFSLFLKQRSKIQVHVILLSINNSTEVRRRSFGNLAGSLGGNPFSPPSFACYTTSIP